MKGFLFDENIPRVPSLPVSLPIIHALDLGPRLSDSEIWTHAQNHDLAIVSKDADFSQRMIVAQPPPRVVHLRVGNMKRREFVAWLELTWPLIEISVMDHKLLNVHRDRIESIR